MISTVKPPLLIAVCCLISTAVLGVTRDAASQERNYQVIVDRNPFGLRPPPPPPTNTLAAAQPKDEILLTGITTIGEPRAYFTTKAPPGKSPDEFSLGINERKDTLEVIDIDVTGVRVRNSGVEELMTFASNGVKAPATAGGTPGVPGSTRPGAVHSPLPTATFPGTTTPRYGRIRTIPSRNVRTGPAAGSAIVAAPSFTPVPSRLPARPDPDAAVRDVISLEAQRRLNPNMQFPPTPGLPQ